MPAITIRELDPNNDTAEWLRMRLLLWPDGTAAEYEADLADMLTDSDTELDNDVSQAAHIALGYEVAGRNVHFRKQL